MADDGQSELTPSTPSGVEVNVEKKAVDHTRTKEQLEDDEQHRRQRQQYGFEVDRRELQQMVADKSAETYAQLGYLDGVAEKLKADLQRGLSEADVIRQRLVYGENRMPEQDIKSFLQHLIEALNDLTLMILAVAATITIIFGLAVTNNSSDWIQGISIMLAVIIVSGVTSVVNYWQDGEFQSLSASKENRDVTVMRDDKEQQLSIFDVVVGDVLKVSGGDVIPCDGILIRGHGISVTEAQINGESRPAKITDKSPYLIGGAQINDGSGWMLVCAVGVESTYGQIVASLQGAEQEDTPLQEKLDVLATQIGYVGIAFGTATFIVLFIRLFAEGKDDSEWYVEVVGYLVIGITIVVVAVPEGLPLAVTISLAWSMQAMTRDMSLVRELAACETMGSATAICSDKTGTLTLNQMTVVAGYFFGRLHLNGAPKEAEIGDGHTGNLAALVRGIAWNATGTVNYPEGKAPQFIGNRTECALLHLLKKDLDVNFVSERKSAEQRLFYRENFSSDRKRMTTVYVVTKTDEDGPNFLKELAKDAEGADADGAEDGDEAAAGEQEAAGGGAAGAADGEGEDGSDTPSDIGHTKSTIPHPKVAHRLPSTGHIPYPEDEVAGYRLVCKGASEILLELCTKYRQQNGEEAPITDEMRSTLKEHILKLARRGLRTLVVAERRVSPEEAPCKSDVSQEDRDDAYHQGIADLEKNLTLLCIAGIQDPLRAEVPAAVRVCKQAGIRVRMVTGDNIETAMQIARSCGIMTDEYNVAVTGTQYRTMSDEERVEALPKLAVMARSLPTDKLLMVRDLKNRMNEVVAVTGDGTNDAPALKEAHVGLSMGITGTEVAKEASKIIILDDNFASIVATVKWGRSVFKNISSFLAFQLAINVSALTITFVIACTNDGSTSSFPITPTQLIYVNLIMDSLGALMLATSPPEERMMLQEPNSHEKPLLTKILMKMVLAHGVWETIVVLVLALTEFGKDVLLVPDSAAVGSREHNTAVFNAFIFMVIWNKLHAAKIHDELDNIFTELMNNMLALIILVGILVLQIIIIEVGGEDVFQTVPQKWDQWLVAVAIGFTSVPLGYLVKFIPYYDEYDVLAKTYGFWAPPGAAEKADEELEKNRVQRGQAGDIAQFADESGGSAAAAGQSNGHIELPETPKQTDGVGSGATGGTA